ncbi:MAG: hypothetical protein ABI837_19270 [Acidobacteriota bacterium]
MAQPYDPSATPWIFDDDAFYELTSLHEKFEFVLRYAVLAPSSHNQQPWSFRITDQGVEVFADATRRLPVIDPDDREMTISIGAAIANLRVAAAHFGFESTALFPEAGGTGAVATIALQEAPTPDERRKSLFHSIKLRHTNRMPFDEKTLDPAALSRVLDVVEEYPDTFHIVYRQDQQRAADLIAVADQLLMADAAYRSELAACLNTATGAEDGLTGDALGIPATIAAAAPFVLRHVDLGSVQARHDQKLTMSSAALVVVTADDDAISLLRAGEALEYLLLTITGAGLQYSFLNAPIQRAELRARVDQLSSSRFPAQLIVRIGHGQTLSGSSPRRPLDAVVV